RMSKVVTGPNGPLPAYLRFIPNTAPEAIIEAFSDSTGHATVVLDADSYTVLVVPSIAGAAPRRIVNWSSSNPFVVTDAGTPVSGEVRDPAGAAIGGAKVQLTIDGVPSTLATTAGDGSFQLRAPTVAGAITVDGVRTRRLGGRAIRPEPRAQGPRRCARAARRRAGRWRSRDGDGRAGSRRQDHH